MRCCFDPRITRQKNCNSYIKTYITKSLWHIFYLRQGRMYITEKKKEQQLYILPGKDVDRSKLQLKNQMED